VAAGPSGWAGSLPVVEVTGHGVIEAVVWSETRTPAKRRGRVAGCIGDDCQRGGDSDPIDEGVGEDTDDCGGGRRGWWWGAVTVVGEPRPTALEVGMVLRRQLDSGERRRGGWCRMTSRRGAPCWD
jgi:hypothetical protein